MKIGTEQKPLGAPKAIRPAFQELDTVELVEKVKTDTLQKGDVGTVMDTFTNKTQIVHLVVFEEGHRRASRIQIESLATSFLIATSGVCPLPIQEN